MNAKKAADTQQFDAGELGAMMREMRENLGHELAAVAADLRIRLVYLEAIEAGRLKDLPGSAYVSGFLRSYSDYLGLDGEEIVRRFRMAGVEISNQTQLHLPSPVEEGRLPTAPVLVLAAVVAAAAYGGWYYFSSPDRDPVDKIASLPAEISRLVDGARENTAQVPAATSPAAASGRADPASDGAFGSGAVAPTEESAGPDPSAEPAELAARPEVAPDASNTARTETPGAAPGSVPAPLTAESTPDAAAPETSDENTIASIAAGANAITENDSGTSAAPAVSEASTEPAATAEPSAETETAPTHSAASAPPSAPNPAPVAERASEPASPPQMAESASLPPVPVQQAALPPRTETADTPAPPAARDTTAASPGSAATRIVVRAKADSFVAVLTSDNQPLFSQLMRSGDSYEVPSGVGLVLETGNAGALEITVGGRPVPAIGPSGEVRRNIPLDAARLLEGAN